jgi:hypothetical protein
MLVITAVPSEGIEIAKLGTLSERFEMLTELEGALGILEVATGALNAIRVAILSI